MDLNKVLDCEGNAEVVTAFVDLREFHYRGVSPFERPIALTAKGENHVGVVTLNCTYIFSLCLSCDRCLAPFTTEVKQHTCHTVVRQLNDSDEEGYLVLPDGFVELDELATNDIVLALPSKFLCKEDCKGLCPVCGCDLNATSCGCSKKQTDPRLAGLDKFFED